MEQVDTIANTDVPFNVRGLHYAEFDNPDLADLPFAPPMPTPAFPAPEFPAPQVTAYRPMSLRDILMPGSIRKLADAVRAITDALRFIQRGDLGALPASPRAGRHQPGRFLALRSLHRLGSATQTPRRILPLDFSAPLPTHLHTSAYFDALGDDHPDQSLRHQVKHRAHFFADLDLQVVVCPHLLSLADGFANVDKG